MHETYGTVELQYFYNKIYKRHEGAQCMVTCKTGSREKNITHLANTNSKKIWKDFDENFLRVKARKKRTCNHLWKLSKQNNLRQGALRLPQDHHHSHWAHVLTFIKERRKIVLLILISPAFSESEENTLNTYHISVWKRKNPSFHQNPTSSWFVFKRPKFLKMKLC